MFKVNSMYYVILICLIAFISLAFIYKPSFKTKLAGKNKSAAEILGNSNYQAICYGGYRSNTREIQPTIEQLKEDLLILHALGIKIVRTYNTKYAEAKNLLQAITELKKNNQDFEMYVMLGAWIDCKNAWTTTAPIHELESEENNAAEIERAVKLANQYPEIVKIISVGNEAMVKWASSYYVTPNIILKWVEHLQKLKKEGQLDKKLWITTSDNFASWGGGDSSYHVEDLKKIYQAVDYVSIHTYPMHDTHYNPIFWGLTPLEQNLSQEEKINALMLRSLNYAKMQYMQVRNYMKSIGVQKPIHIGETGWASQSESLYGNKGSRACDEYKSAKYYQLMREWTAQEKITCFYFEAFDEPWKDAQHPQGSENHFGLFTVDGEAKYALWNQVDKGLFNGMTRDGKPIVKTHQGVKDQVLNQVEIPIQIKKQ